MSNEQKQEPIIVGVDLHPSCIAATALEGYNPMQAKRLWTHGKIAIEDVDNWLVKNVPKDATLVVEAGNTSFEFATKVKEIGYNCIVTESGRLGKIKKSYCKNDKEDSLKIAKAYLSGLAPDVWQPDPETRELRELFFSYDRSRTDSTRTRNRIKSFATEHGIRWKKGLSLNSSHANDALVWLKEQREWSPRQLNIMSILFEDFRHSDRKRTNLKGQVTKEVCENQQMRALMKLCGIRAITAFALVAFIGDINRFKSAKKLVAYIGFNPKVDQSGTKCHHGTTSKAGRKELRALLVQGAQAIFKATGNNTGSLQAWGVKLMMRKGKKLAVAAVARKMVVACWYILKGIFKKSLCSKKSIECKIQKIATDLGKEMIREMGYDSNKKFREHFYEMLILET